MRRGTEGGKGVGKHVMMALLVHVQKREYSAPTRHCAMNSFYRPTKQMGSGNGEVRSYGYRAKQQTGHDRPGVGGGRGEIYVENSDPKIFVCRLLSGPRTGGHMLC
jgi:hypothetical protein